MILVGEVVGVIARMLRAWAERRADGELSDNLRSISEPCYTEAPGPNSRTTSGRLVSPATPKPRDQPKCRASRLGEVVAVPVELIRRQGV